MNLTSRKIGKELHKISGWEPPFFTMIDGKLTNMQYDLGYLLRRLPQESQIDKGHFQYGDGIRYHAKYSWNTELPNRERHYATESAATPEDAAARLAIRLFEQGIMQGKK